MSVVQAWSWLLLRNNNQLVITQHDKMNEKHPSGKQQKCDGNSKKQQQKASHEQVLFFPAFEEVFSASEMGMQIWGFGDNSNSVTGWVSSGAHAGGKKIFKKVNNYNINLSKEGADFQ